MYITDALSIFHYKDSLAREYKFLRNTFALVTCLCTFNIGAVNCVAPSGIFRMVSLRNNKAPSNSLPKYFRIWVGFGRSVKNFDGLKCLFASLDQFIFISSDNWTTIHFLDSSLSERFLRLFDHRNFAHFERTHVQISI